MNDRTRHEYLRREYEFIVDVDQEEVDTSIDFGDATPCFKVGTLYVAGDPYIVGIGGVEPLSGLRPVALGICSDGWILLSVTTVFSDRDAAARRTVAHEIAHAIANSLELCGVNCDVEGVRYAIQQSVVKPLLSDLVDEVLYACRKAAPSKEKVEDRDTFMKRFTNEARRDEDEG